MEYKLILDEKQMEIVKLALMSRVLDLEKAFVDKTDKIQEIRCVQEYLWGEVASQNLSKKIMEEKDNG